MVIAQLYIQGTCYGNHMFMVPIRDMVTHEPLLGVEVGDIGPKVAIDDMDMGYLRLTDVRIPRVNMLMRYSQVCTKILGWLNQVCMTSYP